MIFFRKTTTVSGMDEEEAGILVPIIIVIFFLLIPLGISGEADGGENQNDFFVYNDKIKRLEKDFAGINTTDESISLSKDIFTLIYSRKHYKIKS